MIVYLGYLQTGGMGQFALIVVSLRIRSAELVVSFRAEDGTEQAVKILARRQLFAAGQSTLALVHAHFLD